MPFQQMVEEFNRRSRYQINSEAIQTRVEIAMIHDGEERDQALKRALLHIFPQEARNHERVKMEACAQMMTDPTNLLEDYLKMPDHHTFLTNYIDLICECAKEYDPDYKPPFMLGLQRDEVKRLHTERIQSCTIYDNVRYTLFHTRGLDESKRLIKLSIFNKDENQVYHYANTEGRRRLRIDDIHIQNVIAKEELAGKSIWWKIRHPIQTYDMWSFIKAADKALKDVQFTAEDGVRVVQDYKAHSFIPEDETQRLMNDIDKLYDHIEKERSAPQSSVISQAKENDKQPIQVDIPDPFASKEVSQPVAQAPSLEKDGIQINS